MRFDDTLETVLAADISSPYGKASAWRQLVDLIGRRRVPADPRAIALLTAIREDVSIAVRTASARALEMAEPPRALVQLCATDRIEIAAPVLRSARLNSGEWIDLLPRLSAAGRSVLRARRDLPPGIDQALRQFESADFAIESHAEPVEAIEAEAPAAEGPIDPNADRLPVATLADDACPLPTGEPKDAPGVDPGVAGMADTRIDWTEVVARWGTGEVVPPALDAAEERPRIRLRAWMDSVNDDAPEPAAARDDHATEPPPVDGGASTAPFISIGAAAAGIPLVAAALKEAANDGGGPGSVPLTQSETEDHPFTETGVAGESEAAHQAIMSGEDMILADRDGAAADAGVHPIDSGPEAGAGGAFEIADVVARIDAFYANQADPQPVHPHSRDDGFRFETDESGVIRWVDGITRMPIVGLSLDMTGAPDGSRVDGVAAGAYRRRAAFTDARLFVVGDSDAAGDWRISATPAFDAATGRFTGYRGVARRPRVDEQATRAAIGDVQAADSLRQLMHELRTPTNAIAGFAEMIEHQMLGAAPTVYRERAAAIRDCARALLGAIDDLDIAARIEASALRLSPGDVALRPILARAADDLDALARLRGAWIALPVDNLTVSGDPRATERLIARTLTTLVAAAGEGERIEVRLTAESEHIAIAFTRPHALSSFDGDALFAIDDERADSALLGAGFALRLVRNLARELGGSLVIDPEALTVRLPTAVTKSLEQVR